jgi:ABC-type phosphate transport system substrate-binding protein
MKRRIGANLALLLASAAAAALGVDSALPAYASAGVEVAGELRLAGGDTMRPLVESWGLGFRALYPNVTVRVDSAVSLSADGFKALHRGQVDVVTFVREPFPAEVTGFTRKFGYPPLLILPVAVTRPRA